MRKRAVILFCALAIFIASGTVFAQPAPKGPPPRNPGPNSGPGPNSRPGPNPRPGPNQGPVPGQRHDPGPGVSRIPPHHGPIIIIGPNFTSQPRFVSVLQAILFGHGTPVVIRGTIIDSYGNNSYLFRDLSGEVIIRANSRTLRGVGLIMPGDLIEITGKTIGDQRSLGIRPEIHVESIRKL